jgi:MSHA biogenesis protein MshO
MKYLRGFTLVEMIMVIVITGIVAGMVAIFIARPVEGYVSSVRRAGMTDVADLALKRMALEIRTAVPNSVQVTSSDQIEFIPARTGGRYCTESDGCSDTLSFSFIGSGGDTFDVLGPAVTVVANDWLVIYNTGQSGLDAYGVGPNRRAVTTSAGTVSALAFSGTVFPFTSPSNRFQLVPNAGPVKFKCANNELRRYDSYGWTHTETGTGALLASADTLTCTFTYAQSNATDGLVGLLLTLTREGETVNLRHQIHVDNMP